MRAWGERTLPSARIRAGAAVLVVLLASAGCGKKPEPTPVSIKGRVEFGNSKPGGLLLLTLHPLEETNKRNRKDAMLLGEKDGSFEGSCLPGRYKATLNAVPRSGGNPAAAGSVGGVPGRTPNDPTLQALSAFTQTATTPLEIDVPEGGKQDIVLLVNVPGS